MTPKQIQEFDEKYGINMQERKGTLVEAEMVAERLTEIKAFITHLLNSEREEIAKEIETEKEKMWGYNHPHDIVNRAATIARSRITK